MSDVEDLAAFELLRKEWVKGREKREDLEREVRLLKAAVDTCLYRLDEARKAFVKLRKELKNED